VLILSFSTVFADDASSFPSSRAQDFVNRVALSVGSSAARMVLSLQGGSLQVTTHILTAADSERASIVEQVNLWRADPSSATRALGGEVLSISAVWTSSSMSAAQADIASLLPPSAPSLAPPPPMLADLTSWLTPGVGGLAAMGIALVLTVRRCSSRCFRRADTALARPPSGVGVMFRPSPTRSDAKAEAVAVTLLLALPQSTFRAEPRKAPAADGAADEAAEECSLCLESYNDGQQLRVLPCEHRFHCYCIDNWFMGPLQQFRQRYCPLCKADPLRGVWHTSPSYDMFDQVTPPGSVRSIGESTSASPSFTGYDAVAVAAELVTPGLQQPPPPRARPANLARVVPADHLMLAGTELFSPRDEMTADAIVSLEEQVADDVQVLDLEAMGRQGAEQESGTERCAEASSPARATQPAMYAQGGQGVDVATHPGAVGWPPGTQQWASARPDEEAVAPSALASSPDVRAEDRSAERTQRVVATRGLLSHLRALIWPPAAVMPVSPPQPAA